MSSHSAESLLADLERRGAVVKRAKSGRLHTLDLKPIAAQLSNADVTALAVLSDIRHLELDGAAIDDQAIPALQQLAKLNYLSLQQTTVSDQSVEALQQMQQLKFLLLTGTAVSKEGLANLRRGMIGTRIVFL